MEWMTLSGGVPCLSLISLGTSYRDKYYISNDCLMYLGDIVNKLDVEDPVTRVLRRALGFMDILNKDLIPILINGKDQPSIFRATIKLLVSLTVPVECLVCVEAASQSPTSQHIVHELTQLLYSAKEAFLDPRATRAVLDDLHRLLEKQPLSTEDSEAVNQSLLLIRNILHAPERPPNPPDPEDVFEESRACCGVGSSGGGGGSQTPYLGPHSHSHGYTADCSQQNRLLWNLFAQGFDRLLITMLSYPQKDEWAVTIVQLIALFYKDQHVENMQKLLGSWLNSATSDSSEDDDESNTSPPIGPCNSPQMMTSSSDPTSDSSDSAQRNAACAAETKAVENESQPANEAAQAGKGVRGKSLHRASAAAAAPGGDTASSCSAATSHCSVSEKSRRSSHSTSSGFHSENSSTQQHGSKDSDGHRRDSSKRHRHTGRSPEAGSTLISEDALIEATAAATLEVPTVSVQPVAESAGKRNKKGKAGKSTCPPEKEKRQKKLIKRSRAKGQVKIKAIVQYVPNEEDIAQLLKEFTVDFLLNGYNTLVGELHKQLMRRDTLPFDKSHFLWLITYFLRFASQLELDMEHLKNIFSVDLLCYLTWEAVMETEEFEMSSLQPGVDLKPGLRRLHLGVTAIREYLQALETYSRLGSQNCTAVIQQQAGAEDREDKISTIRGCLPAIKDLRQLFLLQLRHFNPVIQSRRYLRDVITANHVLLLTLERAVQHSPYTSSFDLRQHLGQFCSRNVLARYGTALEDFKTNGPFVNDCILTVLHHIGADLGRADLLCEPIILRPFSRIWEEEFNMCDDWDDLIEYVVQKFLRNFQTGGASSGSGTPPLSLQDQEGGASRSMASDHSAEALHEEQATGADDPFADVPISDIETLKGRLRDSGFQKQLDWIQASLLTVCSARLGSYVGEEFKYPIACLSMRMNVPCPMVPWTDMEAAALRSEVFIFLLHRMGLLPATPHTGLYPRIPRDWDADALYSAALLFGPVLQQQVDFDLTRVHQVQLPLPNSPNDLPMDGCHPLRPWLVQPYLGPGPSNSFTAMPTNWTYWVEQSGSLFRSAEITSQYGHNSSHSMSNQSHRPLDSVSTTSSLEVHKTDSSDDEEMEDGAAAGSHLGVIHRSSGANGACSTGRNRSSSSGKMTEGEDDGARPDWPMTNTTDETFEMAPLLDEVLPMSTGSSGSSGMD